MKNAELIKSARTIADSIHVHSSFQDWQVAEKDTLEKCADALEAAEKRIAELEDEIKDLENAYIAELTQAHINVQRSAKIYREWYEAVGRKKNEQKTHGSKL